MLMLENGLKAGDLAWYETHGIFHVGGIVRIVEIDNAQPRNVKAVLIHHQDSPYNGQDFPINDVGMRFIPLHQAKQEADALANIANDIIKAIGNAIADDSKVTGSD